MKARAFIGAAVALLVAATFAGCTEYDGDWDPMKWSTEVKASKDGSVDVPKSGGAYVFKCTNYGGFWLSSAAEEAEGKSATFYADSDGNTWQDITTSWAKVKAEDGVLTVTIEPNTSETERQLNVCVTAGDIFDYFDFKQQ